MVICILDVDWLRQPLLCSISFQGRRTASYRCPVILKSARGGSAGETVQCNGSTAALFTDALAAIVSTFGHRLQCKRCYVMHGKRWESRGKVMNQRAGTSSPTQSLPSCVNDQPRRERLPRHNPREISNYGAEAVYPAKGFGDIRWSNSFAFRLCTAMHHRGAASNERNIHV